MENFESRIKELESYLREKVNREESSLSIRSRKYPGQYFEDYLKATESFFNKSIPNDLLDVFPGWFDLMGLKWINLTEDETGIWNIGTFLRIYSFKYIYNDLIKRFADGEKKDDEDEDLFNMRRDLLQKDGMFEIGSLWKFLILVRFVEASHELYLWYPAIHCAPARLKVKMGEMMDLITSVGGIDFSVIHLCEKYPPELSEFPTYDFFNAAPRLFPEADFAPFTRFEFEGTKPSIAQINRQYNYRSRIEQYLGSLPEGSRVYRWHSYNDISFFPSTYTQLLGPQVKHQLRLSEPMLAFWMISYCFLFHWGREEESKANFEFPELAYLFTKNHAPSYYKLPVEAAPHLENKYVFYTDPYNDMLVEFHGEGVCSFFLLYLEADDYELHHITDDFDWLITQLLNTRGMFWWNYFLVFQASDSDQRYLKFHQQMLEYFPDADMSRYPDPADL